MAAEPLSFDVQNAGVEQFATQKEMEAALTVFTAACARGSGAGQVQATELAHCALQAHLDAIAGSIAIARKALGL